MVRADRDGFPFFRFFCHLGCLVPEILDSVLSYRQVHGRIAACGKLYDHLRQLCGIAGLRAMEPVHIIPYTAHCVLVSVEGEFGTLVGI